MSNIIGRESRGRRRSKIVRTKGALSHTYKGVTMIRQSYKRILLRLADVAQQVEQGFRKAKVLGSIPSVGSSRTPLSKKRDKVTAVSSNRIVGATESNSVISFMRVTRKYLLGRQKKIHKSWKSISHEDKNDLARLIKVAGVTILILFLVYNFGIKGFGQLAGVWSIFAGKSGAIPTDTITPPPPTFNPIPSYTNVPTIKLSGYAKPGAEVKIFINETEIDQTTVEAGGTFSLTDVPLNDGKNVITATATNQSGDTSLKSAELIITLDRKPPNLVVNKPTDGQKFVGQTQQQIDVEGLSDPESIVKVNDVQATVSSDGSFKATLTLNAGDNHITVIATDKAGNAKKVALTVNYASQ